MQPLTEELDVASEVSALDRLRAGQPFSWSDTELAVVRMHARKLVREFNSTPEDRHLIRLRMLASLFGSLGVDPDVEAPLFVEFGRHVFAGDRLAVGPRCTLVDVGRITLGSDVRLDAGVHLFAVVRPLNAQHRARGFAQASPITIGDGVWIGGCSVINGGVTIGDGTTVAPGSVVMEDLPAEVYAAGNPCRVVRELRAER